MKDFSKITIPLCKLLQKDVEFHFDDKCKKAFETSKGLLTSAPIMQPPNWNEPFEIVCDASVYAIAKGLAKPHMPSTMPPKLLMMPN